MALLAAAVAGSPPVQAFETDQFLALEVPLEDSAEPVNAYVNEHIERVLEKLNRKRPRIACEEIPPKLYRHLFTQTFLRSRFRHFLKTSEEVDRFPERGVGFFRHLKLSIYRRPSFPYILPLSPTVRVGEVHVGADKLGHLFGFGRRYYKRYREARRQGLDEEDATRKVILWGFKLERILVGGWTDGIISYGDLEANYQGLRLARDFCEGDRPYLLRGEKGWVLAEKLDLRDYVNPRFDESYHTNYYTRRWKSIRGILLREHCSKLSSPLVVDRMGTYQALDEPNFSTAVIEDYYRRRGRDPRPEQSLEVVCKPLAAEAGTTTPATSR